MVRPIQIIAEVKTASPFGYRSEKSWDELFALAEKTGDIISVHTDPRWSGSFDLIKRARELTKKPILAKGIHASDEDVAAALEAGADFVLVVGRIPSTDVIALDRCLLEPESLAQLKEWLATGTANRNVINVKDAKIVWNSRDLATGGNKKESFADARAIFSGWMCQASNIKTVGDIDPSADAVLVGTHLAEFAESVL